MIEVYKYLLENFVVVKQNPKKDKVFIVFIVCNKSVLGRNF